MSRTRIIMLIGGFVLILLVIEVVYQTTHLIITGQYPSSNATNMPTVAPIKLTFNNAVDPTSIKYTITPAVDIKVQVTKGQILFIPTAGFITDQTYTFNLSSVSTKGGGTTTSRQFSFTTKYLTAAEVPSWVNQANLQQTDSHLNSNPIVAMLPYETLDYKIEYHLGNNQEVILDIQLYGQYNRPDQYNDYIQQLKDNKAAALQYLKDKGFDPKSYTIIYTPAMAQSY